MAGAGLTTSGTLIKVIDKDVRSAGGAGWMCAEPMTMMNSRQIAVDAAAAVTCACQPVLFQAWRDWAIN